MLEADAKPTAGGAPTAGAPRRSLSRIRRWFSRRQRFRRITRPLDEDIALSQSHTTEFTVIQPRLQGVEKQIAELAAVRPTLLKLQSAWQQQVAIHRHMIEVTRSLEQDISQKLDQGILQKIDHVLRQELDLGLGGPSVFASVLNGLWDNFGQLHAQVQGIAELVRIRDMASLEERIAAGFSSIEAKFAASLEEAVAVRLSSTEAQFDAEIQSTSAQAVRREELEAVRARGEFIRRELMYEFRAVLQEKGPPKTPPVSPKIVNAAKVAGALGGGALRINVGCGHVALADYVNVDRRELPGIDVIADATDLPFDDNAVAEIYSSHLLEHFPEEILRRVLLLHWRKKLRPGGVLRVIVPDAEAMISDFVAGEMSFSDLREVTFGGQDYSGDFHFTMFSRDHIKGLLTELGFGDLAFTVLGRKNGQCRELEIVGVRHE